MFCIGYFEISASASRHRHRHSNTNVVFTQHKSLLELKVLYIYIFLSNTLLLIKSQHIDKGPATLLENVFEDVLII